MPSLPSYFTIQIHFKHSKMKFLIRRIATQLEFRQAVDLDDSIGGPPARFTLPLSVLRSKISIRVFPLDTLIISKDTYLDFETRGTDACINFSGVAPPEANLPHPVIQHFLLKLSIGIAGLLPSGTQTSPTALFKLAGFSSFINAIS